MDELVGIKVGKPEFAIVIDNLKAEVLRLEKNAREIFEKTCTFKDLRKPSNLEPEKKEQIESGILWEFNDLIETIKIYNSILEEAKQGLTLFVG